MLRQHSGSDTFAGLLGEARAASTAGGGTSLTTTAGLISLPRGASHFSVLARNFGGGAVAVQVALNPFLRLIKTTDLLQTLTDYSHAAHDADASTTVVLSSLNTFANGDAIYVGSHVPIRGLAVTMTASLNGNASILSGYYWNGSAWTDLSVTDGTIAPAGTCLGQSGTITWTVPTAWAKARLGDIVATPALFTLAVPREDLYWLRLEVSAALDASCTAQQMLPLNRSTAYAELTTEAALLQFRTTVGVGGVGCLEAKTNAGTASLVVNAFADGGACFA